MATFIPPEIKPASWLNYFFLYDGSKVQEEGDPTRAGICYFYPSQTLLDQQELLCGQLAGVVRCVSDISGSPPSLIRLRKLKFAIKVEGDHLWGLGCAVELADVSCTRLLEQLAGLFTFYNGPVSLAYKNRSREELSSQWDTFISQVLGSTSELHRTFSALCNLDHTKVEPLLLLKAALLLQTCQRAPHVLAGCILYKGLIVSSQLPPSLTSKLLLHPVEADRKIPGACWPAQLIRTALPPNVWITPVFLSKEEASSLQEFQVERVTRLQDGSFQHPPWGQSTSVPAENATWTSATPLEPMSPDRAWPSGSGENGLLSGHEEKRVGSAWNQTSGLSAWLQKEPAFSQEELDLSAIHIPETVCALGSRGHCCEESASVTCHPASMPPEDTGSCLSPCPFERMPKNGALEQHIALPGTSGHAPVPGADHTRRSSRPVAVPLQGLGPTGRAHSVGQRGDGGHRSSAALALACASHLATTQGHGPPADTLDSEPAPVGPPLGLVPMNLYTHSVKGLVLSLLAEEPLLGDAAAIEEVYHSSLASLNGLEVHLEETLPGDDACPASHASSYNFTHYDRIQRVLTANLPQVAASQDRRFLQAVSLMHSDFAQLPTLYEMTARNASTAVYACCSPARETFFQQRAPAARSSGFPNPQDCAFHLAGRAKQELLKHGVSLL
uniref:HPS4, biogenesis of lysosomal organelles complex 3 subunit 2 n=1 Tax=Jaculus jaculus TaxID=51337 RepID=A0A8C5P1H0_JACJA